MCESIQANHWLEFDVAGEGENVTLCAHDVAVHIRKCLSHLHFTGLEHEFLSCTDIQRSVGLRRELHSRAGAPLPVPGHDAGESADLVEERQSGRKAYPAIGIAQPSRHCGCNLRKGNNENGRSTAQNTGIAGMLPLTSDVSASTLLTSRWPPNCGSRRPRL